MKPMSKAAIAKKTLFADSSSDEEGSGKKPDEAVPLQQNE